MQFFKTEASIPEPLRFAGRPRIYRAAVRYGHARLHRDDRYNAADASVPAPVLVELPRVQAVVDAIIEARAA